MPGKKGVKLIPRKSKSGKFFSVKSLVFSLLEKDPNITRAAVEKVVAKEYPGSNFLPKDGKGGHFPWYKTAFTRKNLEKDFSLKERGDSHDNHKQAQQEAESKPKQKEEPTAETIAPEHQEDGIGPSQPPKGNATKPRARVKR